MVDHYAALGLNPAHAAQLAQADIEKAYRVRARECHPDKGGDAAVFAAMKVAYDVLGNPEARRVYDEETAAATSALEAAAAETIAYEDLPKVAETIDDGWAYACRCGGTFEILHDDVADARQDGVTSMLVCCGYCSLHIEVAL